MDFIVNLACGLANRMFQYSFYLYLVDNGYNASVDFYRSGKLAHESVEWNRVFPNATLCQAGRFKAFLLGGGNDLFTRFRRRFLPFTTRILQMPTAFDAYLPDGNKGTQYVIGVFQNAKMVENIRSRVLEAFSFAPFSDDYNIRFANEIENCESVAIHIRKGKDYQERIWYKNTCPLDYYTHAVEFMKTRLKNPRFYVFADNKEWVRENFTGFEYTLVDGNPGAGYGSHFDMQLMSLCHHNIISNSTYSWWSAYLNRHVDRIVTIPQVWFNPDSCEDHTSARLLCQGWQPI